MYHYPPPEDHAGPSRFNNQRDRHASSAGSGPLRWEAEGSNRDAFQFAPPALSPEYSAPLPQADPQTSWSTSGNPPTRSTYTIPNPYPQHSHAAQDSSYNPHVTSYFATPFQHSHAAPIATRSSSHAPYYPTPARRAYTVEPTQQEPFSYYLPDQHDNTSSSSYQQSASFDSRHPYPPHLAQPDTLPPRQLPVYPAYTSNLPNRHYTQPSEPLPRPPSQSSSICRSPQPDPEPSPFAFNPPDSTHSPNFSSYYPFAYPHSATTPTIYTPRPVAVSAPPTPPRSRAGQARMPRTRSHHDLPSSSRLSTGTSRPTSTRSLTSPRVNVLSRPSSSGSLRNDYTAAFRVTRGGGSTKAKVDIPAFCVACNTSIGRLVLRGATIESMTPLISATCITCIPPPPLSQPVSTTSPRKTSNAATVRPQDMATYADTMSPVIDASRGMYLSEELTGRPIDGPQPELPDELKGQAMTCDVCARIIGAGTVRAFVEGHPTTFTTEVICARCDEMYQPCSDCGGGGGRLTPGRWRCKELFSNGRKTCDLSHARTPTLEELTTEIVLVEDIPPESLPALEQRCQLLYRQTRLGMLARPEYLCKGDGLATTFAQAERNTSDLWDLLKTLLYPSPDPLMRRYIGLYFSSPQRRKARTQDKAPVSEDSKVVTGYFLFEHDVRNGVMFFAVTCPWTTSGLAYDANTTLAELCTARVRADLDSLNDLQASSNLPLYPSLTSHFLISPFKSTSRFTQTLERRGYLTFEDHILQYPLTNLDAFPPNRRIFIPREYLGAWSVFVLQLVDEDDLGGPPTRRRRRRRVKKE